MVLGADELIEIEKVLAGSDTVAGRFPNLAWMRCDASDVIETPFRSYGGIDLHLIDGSDHCVKITSDPSQATGIVLAVRSMG
jgi:hypothetical protein